MTNCKFQGAIKAATQFPFDEIFYSQEEGNFKAVKDQNEPAVQVKQNNSEPISPLLDIQILSKSSKQGKKCLNHNFQKHAVVTVKKLMRLRYNSEASQIEKLAHKMWTIFMTSNIKSKKILVVLFGRINFTDQRDLSLFKMCGFGEILEEQQSSIWKAQEMLRARFNELVTERKVWQNIRESRSIKAEEEFYAYFVQLLRLIREGPFQKLRINDKTSKKIQEQIVNRTLSKIDSQN